MTAQGNLNTLAKAYQDKRLKLADPLVPKQDQVFNLANKYKSGFEFKPDYYNPVEGTIPRKGEPEGLVRGILGEEGIEYANKNLPGFMKSAYNQSLTGMADELIQGGATFDLTGYDPSTVEDIAATVLSFVMPLDLATFYFGGQIGKGAVIGFQKVLTNRLINTGVTKLVAEKAVFEGAQKLLPRMAAGAAQSGTALGTYSGAASAAQQQIYEGEIDGFQTIKDALHGGALGVILGATGGAAAPMAKYGLAGKAGQIGAEIGAFGGGEAALGGRLPTLDDFARATGIVIGLKITHMPQNIVKRRIAESLYRRVAEEKMTLDEAVQDLVHEEAEINEIVGERPEPAPKPEKPVKPEKPIGFSTHGRWADVKKILALEKERENYIDPELEKIAESGEYDAIWVTKEGKDAVRYNRDADKFDVEKFPPTKEELEDILEIDLTGAKPMKMEDGDGGNLWIRPKSKPDKFAETTPDVVTEPPTVETPTKPKTDTGTPKKPSKLEKPQVEVGGEKEPDVSKPVSQIKPKLAQPVMPEPTKLSKNGAKEPWEMTREEYVKSDIDRLIADDIKQAPKDATYIRNSTENEMLIYHKGQVEQALSEGKSVPESVLKDYLDLVKSQEAITKRLTEDSPKVETPKEAIAEIIDGKRESKIGIPEFKKKMVAELDAVIAKAPERPKDLVNIYQRTEQSTRNMTVSELNKYEKSRNEILSKKRKELGVDYVTIEIPGDGEFRFENTKEALSAVRKKVRGLKGLEPAKPKMPAKPPEKVSHETKYEVRQEKVKEGVQVVPVPGSPRKFKPPERIQFAGKSKYTTNGHYIVETKYLDPKVVKKMPFNEERAGLPPAQAVEIVKDFEKFKTRTPAEEVSRVNIDGGADKALFFDGKARIIFDAQYVDFLHRTVDQFSLDFAKNPQKEGSPSHVGIIKSGKKEIGILMPLQMGEGDVATELIIGLKGKLPKPVPKAKRPIKGESDKPISEKTESRKGSKPDTENLLGGERQMPLSMEPKGDVKPVGKHEIKNTIEKLFDIVIATGRIRGKKDVAGTYERHSETARWRSWGDLETAAHESIAHHIDSRNPNIKNIAGYATELPKLDYDYPDKKRPREGFAVFMEYFMTGSGDPQAHAPVFYKSFTEYLKKTDLELGSKIYQVKDMIQRYADQGSLERGYSQHDWAGKSLQTIKEKIEYGKNKFQQYFIESISPIRRMEEELLGVKGADVIYQMAKAGKIKPSESPYLLAANTAKAAESVAKEMILGNTFDFDRNKAGKGLQEVLRPVSESDAKIQEFFLYMFSKHAIDSHEGGPKREREPRDPGMEYADAINNVRLLENPVYKKAAKEVVAWEDRVMAYLVEAGGISQEVVDVFRELSPHYLPLQRVFDPGEWAGAGGGAGRGFANVSSPIHKRTGSGRRVKNILESMIRQTAEIISTADRLRVGKAIVELGEKQGGHAKWFREVPMPKKPVKFSLEQIKKQLENAGVDVEDPSIMFDQMMTIFTNAPVKGGKGNLSSFWVNGKQRVFELNPDLYSAVASIQTPNIGPLLKFFSAPARAVRLGATGLQPGFGLITNMLRDTFTFGLQTEFAQGTPLEVAKGLVQRIQPGNEMYKLWKMTGADMSQFLALDKFNLKKARREVINDTAKKKALHVVDHPIEALSMIIEGAKDLFSVTEAAPRLAEFSAALKHGEKTFGKGTADTWLLAGYASSDVTINFRRLGEYGYLINQMIPFWNANVQGLAKFTRFAKAHPTKAAIKAVVGLTIPTAILWAMHHDEEWYRELPDWQRYAYWNFPVGRNKDGRPKEIVRIPRPFEWGWTFASAPEMALEYFNYKDPQLVRNFISELAEQTAPFPPFMNPTAIEIPLELYSNYDFFRDRSIEPFFEVKYKDPADRYSGYTTGTAKAIGRTFGLSPRKIEHLIEKSSGGLGMDILRAVENIGRPSNIESGADIPIAGRLFSHQQSPESRKRRMKQMRQDERSKIKKLRMKGDHAASEKRRKIWNKRYPDYKIF